MKFPFLRDKSGDLKNMNGHLSWQCNSQHQNQCCNLWNVAAKPNAILKGALVEEQDCLAQIYAAAQIMKTPVRMCEKTQIMKMMKIWMKKFRFTANYQQNCGYGWGPNIFSNSLETKLHILQYLLVNLMDEHRLCINNKYTHWAFLWYYIFTCAWRLN